MTLTEEGFTLKRKNPLEVIGKFFDMPIILDDSIPVNEIHIKPGAAVPLKVDIEALQRETETLRTQLAEAQAQVSGLVGALEWLDLDCDSKCASFEYDARKGFPNSCNCGGELARKKRSQALSTLPPQWLEQERRREAVVRAAEKFKEYAAHKTGGLNQIEFFRYKARSAREQRRECADTAIWDSVADVLEAVEALAGKEG